MTQAPSNTLSPKKLLHTKWTAVVPRNKEKPFLVTKVIEPVPPGSPASAPRPVPQSRLRHIRTPVLKAENQGDSI